MTDQSRRDIAEAAYRAHRHVDQTNRSTGETVQCFNPPELWNWHRYQYTVSKKPTPVDELRAEVKQACKDGEGVMLTQAKGKALVKYLEKR